MITISTISRAFRRLALLVLLFLLGQAGRAQDIIIKGTKEEIKAKVLEVDEQMVKYKQFDFLDGPTYSIRKTEVFLILYHNGRRESFDAVPVPPAPAPMQTLRGVEAARAIQAMQNAAAPPPTGPEPTTHAPIRLLLAHQSDGSVAAGAEISTTTFTLEYEGRFIKNFLNYGMALSYSSFSSTFDPSLGLPNVSASVFSYQVFVAPYLPLNRMMGNVAKQNQGLFPYAHIGGSKAFADGAQAGLYYAVGLDYMFSPHIGVTLRTSQFTTLGGGLNVEF